MNLFKHFAGLAMKRWALNCDGCWIWEGYRDRDGYGRTSRGLRAHRIIYQEFKGTIPEGYQLDHLCRNRACVNPDHLEAVTLEENNRRIPTLAFPHARKTHCKQGHEFNEANTYHSFSSNGKPRRHCRACSVIATQRYKERLG